MTNTVTYTVTAKARTEMAKHDSKFSPSLKKLLAAIGERGTFEEVSSKMPKVAEARLREVIQNLVSRGYLEAIDTAATATDLDITRYFNRAIAEPTLQQRRRAEQQTIMGMRSTDKGGYSVNILNRARKRIAPRSGDKYNVIIIDGDEGNALVLARTLLLAGIDTRAAARRDEIVAELSRQPPIDVIAMDVVLPDVIGLELLGRLRAHPFFRTVPIIVMTAKAEHDDVVAALSYGASGYMTKPFKPDALLDSVQGVLGLG